MRLSALVLVLNNYDEGLSILRSGTGRLLRPRRQSWAITHCFEVWDERSFKPKCRRAPSDFT